MIGMTRLDHIGMVVPDAEEQARLLQRLFGFRRLSASENETEVGMTLEVPGGIRWEVLAPRDTRSALHAFLGGPRGPGVHHVGIEVDDIAGAARHFQTAGVEVADGDGNGSTIEIASQRGGRGLTFRLAAAGEAHCGAAVGSGVSDERSSSDPAPDTPPPIGVTAVDHLCHAAPDRDVLGRWYADTFGMRETHRTPPGEHEDLADLVLDVPGGGIRWEVLQPVGADSFVQRFLDHRGPSVHHVALEVADWGEAVAALEVHGMSFFDESTGETDGARWYDAFIHPRETGGVLIQCFWEEQPDAWVASDKVRTG